MEPFELVRLQEAHEGIYTARLLSGQATRDRIASIVAAGTNLDHCRTVKHVVDASLVRGIP